MSVQNIRIDAIRMDGGTQSRAAINGEVVSDYAETIRGGQDLPPVVVFFDGKAYWLADGFHRTNAYIEAGAEIIEADIRQGDKRAAILHSVGANASHGLRRTNADKRRAVMVMLGDEEWSKLTNREIAKTCGVTHTFVNKMKSEVETVSTSGGKGGDEKANTNAAGTEKDSGNRSAEEPEGGGAEGGDSDAPQGPKAAQAGGEDTNAEPVAAPRPPSPYADLTREALEDDHAGAIEVIEGLKGKIKERDHKIDRLEAHIKDLSAANQGAVISKLERQRITLKARLDEAMTATKREEYKRKQAERERDEARAKLREQVIPL